MPRQTLEILPRRFIPFHRRKCFDLRRKKIKVTLRFVDGVIAQLVERLNGIQKVRSSSLLGSTIQFQPAGPRLHQGGTGNASVILSAIPIPYFRRRIARPGKTRVKNFIAEIGEAN